MLAEKTPAGFVAFDLLALGDESYVDRPLSERRAALEGALGHLGSQGPCYLTRTTTDPAEAERWFEHFEGAGLDGVVAKPDHLPYRENERVMLKVKHERTADCVVAGFRWHKSGGVIGSMLLGLYDDKGTLHHVGVTASFTMAKRKELVDTLAPFREGALDNHPWKDWASAMAAVSTGTPRTPGAGRMPGGQSRWNAGKDQSWEPVRPELVVEVRYDKLEKRRLRHGTKLLRFRPDKDPAQCTWRELRPPRRRDDPTVEGLLAG